MTMLIDEADSFIRDSHGSINQELRGVLNSGHTRATAYVMRSVLADDRDWTPKKFSTWGAFAVAAIGSLPDTWINRSIIIRLKRKLRGEKVQRFRASDKKLSNRLAQIAQRIRRWSKDNLTTVAAVKVAPLDEIRDRAADNWETPLAIAAAAGASWLERARAAAIELSGEALDAQSLRTQLLADLRAIFIANANANIFSRELCRKLVAIEGRPWAEYRRNTQISTNQLASLLKSFQIYPTSVRVKVNDETKHGSGYKAKDFADAFKRYLPPLLPEETLALALSPNGDDPQKDEKQKVESMRPAPPSRKATE